MKANYLSLIFTSSPIIREDFNIKGTFAWAIMKMQERYILSFGHFRNDAFQEFLTNDCSKWTKFWAEYKQNKWVYYMQGFDNKIKKVNMLDNIGYCHGWIIIGEQKCQKKKK